MRIAYLDCASGISGDMTLGALVDAGVELAQLQAGIDSLGLPSCRLVASEVKKRGFRATQIVVEHEPEHAHRHLHHIVAMIEQSQLTPSQRELATAIFGRIGKAEAKVHGTTIEKVHFHEVGAVDSIADIVGAAIGWDLLGVDQVVCSPIPTGSGFVEIAHGRCSIPAPATAELLQGVPLAPSQTEGELTTPTGAAIAATLADRFGTLPAMTIDRIGYGSGQKDFEHPNILRLLVGSAVGSSVSSPPQIESICVLQTQLDDASGELIGHCLGALREAGAVDVCTSPLQMKKDRPGTLLTAQCRPELADDLERIIFRETTTLGVRRSVVQRRVLHRVDHQVGTTFGEVPGVLATLPDGSQRFTPEYEACRRIAQEQDVSLAEVMREASAAFKTS